MLALGLFVVLLVGLPLLRLATDAPVVATADAFYRSGSLVFGGGHVVLPLLHATVVDPGWVSEDRFLAGYGLTQAMPGPLFTFAGYLGAASSLPPGGVAGGDRRHRRDLPAVIPPPHRPAPGVGVRCAAGPAPAPRSSA